MFVVSPAWFWCACRAVGIGRDLVVTVLRLLHNNCCEPYLYHNAAGSINYYCRVEGRAASLPMETQHPSGPATSSSSYGCLCERWLDPPPPLSLYAVCFSHRYEWGFHNLRSACQGREIPGQGRPRDIMSLFSIALRGPPQWLHWLANGWKRAPSATMQKVCYGVA